MPPLQHQGEIRAQAPWDMGVDMTSPVTDPLMAIARWITGRSVPPGGGVSEGIAPLRRWIPPRGLFNSRTQNFPAGNNAPIPSFSPEAVQGMLRDITQGRRHMIGNQRIVDSSDPYRLPDVYNSGPRTLDSQRILRQLWGDFGNSMTEKDVVEYGLDSYLRNLLYLRAPRQGLGPNATIPPSMYPRE